MHINTNSTRGAVLLGIALMFLGACGRQGMYDDTNYATQPVVTTTPLTLAVEEPATDDTVSDAPPSVPTSTSVPTNEEPPRLVPDGEQAIPTTQPATTTTTTSTTVPERVEVWADLPDASFIRIDSIGTYAPMEITPGEGISYDPDGPNVGLICGVAPCELGTSWLLGHSHSTGATPGLVVHPEDHADIGVGHIGAQVGDPIVFELADGSSCTYQIVPFVDDLVATNVEVVSVEGSPAMAWPKANFCPDSELPHPWTEWYTPDDESVLYLSTSGGWPTITKCNGKTGRPNVDTVMAVLVESDHAPVYVEG